MSRFLWDTVYRVVFVIFLIMVGQLSETPQLNTRMSILRQNVIMNYEKVMTTDQFHEMAFILDAILDLTVFL